MSITIRPVASIDDCLHIEKITFDAWEGDDNPAPDHLLYTIASNSGCVLIAWDDDVPVGFCYGFTAFIGRTATDPNMRLKHHSHQAGVIPSYQGRGIGAQLKWSQRDCVLAQGINHMTWTFDPLETLNCRLNIHKLGTVCNTYKRNIYGIGRDPLNAGMLTDRFQVDWWLDSTHVEQHKLNTFTHQSLAAVRQAGAATLNQTGWMGSGADDAQLLQPLGQDLSGLETHTLALIAIPNNFQAVKKADLELAKTWRLHTRDLFEAAFAAGFVVTDVLREADQSYHLLEKNWHP